MKKIETRFAKGIEIREDGAEYPVIAGTLLRYGDVAQMPGFRETFESGAFRELPRDLILNVQHQRFIPVSRTPDVELREKGGELLIEATLRTSRGKAAAEDVRAGLLRGFSLEFVAIRERWEGDLRVITEAELKGAALVDSGAYPDSKVAMRNRPGVLTCDGAGLPIWI